MQGVTAVGWPFPLFSFWPASLTLSLSPNSITPNPHHALGWAVGYLSWSESNHCPCLYASISLAINSGRMLQPQGKGQAGQCQQLLRQEDEPAHGQHTVSASQTCPRGGTHHFLQIWGLPQCWYFILHLLLGCLVSQRLQCHYHCCGWSHTTEAPKTGPCPCLQPLGGRLEKHHNAANPKGSTQSGIRSAWGTGAARTTLPTLRKRRSELTLVSVCLLSARDSHHCHIQGTLCSTVVWMLIKPSPAFMCLAR